VLFHSSEATKKIHRSGSSGVSVVHNRGVRILNNKSTHPGLSFQFGFQLAGPQSMSLNKRKWLLQRHGTVFLDKKAAGIRRKNE
jgi:hypothetical protein